MANEALGGRQLMPAAASGHASLSPVDAITRRSANCTATAARNPLIERYSATGVHRPTIHVEVELEGIQDRYVQVLRSYLEHAAPHHPGRLQELFARIPEKVPSAADRTFYRDRSAAALTRASPHFQIQAAANLLLESKMFYVPFVLNSAEIR
ncbi:unnamed protein product, partial [Iphiclides podalirius]